MSTYTFIHNFIQDIKVYQSFSHQMFSNREQNNISIIYHTLKDIQIGYIYRPTQLIFLQIATRVGSQAEKENEWGIAHILEHMFFKGSQKRPSSIQILHDYSMIGANMNAYTDYDHTSYYINMLNEVFDVGLDIIADMYLNPIFPEEEFKKELNPILSEFREKEDDPSEYLYERAMEKFLTHYHPILGTKESILNTTTNTMKQFQTQYYGGQNTIIAASGGIYPEIFFKKIEEYFSQMNQAQTPQFPKCNYNQGELVLYKKDIQESYYLLLFPALPYDSKERHIQGFMNYILGGMDSSLLYERIREELGLSCYEIFSNITRNQSFSVLEIMAGISPEQLDQLDREIHSIINQICNEYISQERIEKAKNTLKTNISQTTEHSRGMSNLLLNSLLRHQFNNPIKEILTLIDSITKEDIIHIAQKTFRNPFFKAILLPESK